jgi:hypothetical protein
MTHFFPLEGPAIAALRDGKAARLCRMVLWGAGLLFFQSLALVLIRSDSALKLNLLLQMAVLLLFALFSKRASGTYLNAPLVFALSIFIWHSTFFVGYYFDLAPLFTSPGGAFNIGMQYVYKATALVGLSIALTIIGMIWGYRRQRIDAQLAPAPGSLPKTCYAALDPGVKRAAWCLFAIMTSILAFFIIREGASVFDRKYTDLYAYAPTSLSAILFFRSQFFWVFVIILLFACYKDNFRVRKLLTILVIALCGLLAMLGPRSGPFVCLIALLLSWDSFIRRVRLHWIAVFVLFLSAASFVIASGREAGLGTHVFNFADTGRENLDLLEIFYEQGRSVTVVLRTMDLTGHSGFMYGRTFLDSAVSVVPLPILEFVGYGYTKPLADRIVDNSPDIALAGGWGSSLIAELYYNFGMLGCFGFLIIGWYVSRSYFNFVDSGNIYSGLKVMTVVSMYTMMMRNDSGSCWRLLIYAFILITLLKRKREDSFVEQELARNNSSREYFSSRPDPAGLRAPASDPA